MPEVASVIRVTQIGVETTPGTGVSANKLLQATMIEPSIKANIVTFRGAGGKFPFAAALGKEWVEADISGHLNYTEIVYLLSSVLKSATPAQITPPSGLAYRWTFTPSQSAVDPVKTFTVESGSSARAMKFTYGLVTDLSISITREKAELKGSMIGRNIQDGITLTASPTAIPLVPVLPSQVSVYLDTSAANIGTTQLLRVLAVAFEIKDRFGTIWTLDATQSSFAAHVETAPKVTLKLTLEADAQGMALLSAMRAGEKRFIRVKAVGPNIETGNDHLFQLDMCGVVSDAGDFSDEDGVFAIEWTFTATYDSDWGKALEVQVVNTLSAL